MVLTDSDLSSQFGSLSPGCHISNKEEKLSPPPHKDILARIESIWRYNSVNLSNTKSSYGNAHKVSIQWNSNGIVKCSSISSFLELYFWLDQQLSEVRRSLSCSSKSEFKRLNLPPFPSMRISRIVVTSRTSLELIFWPVSWSLRWLNFPLNLKNYKLSFISDILNYCDSIFSLISRENFLTSLIQNYKTCKRRRKLSAAAVRLLNLCLNNGKVN